MKIPKIIVTCILILIAFIPNSAEAQEDFIIIVNQDVEETRLTAESLRRIYFGFQTNWSDSKEIRISYAKLQNADFWKLLNTSKANYDQFWIKREDSGNGQLPVAMSSSRSVIDYVANTEGAIGIIRKSLLVEIGNSCKQVAIAD